MCGIFGAFRTLYSVKNEYDKALKALKARGPEATSTLEIDDIGTLGFTRLAINGLTPNGMQPMSKNRVHWIVNGEIYNWKELNTDYDLGCSTGSDCEVVGALYERMNSLGHLFRSLDGVFACIIVDELLKRIIVARDPYGVRPLYKGRSTFFKGYGLFFGSEMKSLFHDAVDIEAFEPGTFEVYDSKTHKLIYKERYHVPLTMKLPAFSSLEDSSKAVRLALESAVRKRMMTERPVAALLSGGLDSSLIAALVSKELRAVGAPPLKTFSIGMPGSSDLAFAKKVAEWIGSDHNEIIVSDDDFFQAIPAVIKDIESYDTTTVRASVGNWLVAREVGRRSDCKVLFNGDGADEVFGSYLYLYNAPSARAYEDEVLSLLKNIHTFDVLRSDRSISSHGLEPRTPFLDKAFVQTVLSIPLEFRQPLKGKQMEKWLLRTAFDDGETLPEEVLWRRKEAFSDGVSGERSWYEIAQEKAVALCGKDWSPAAENYLHNRPTTAEMYYYRDTFEKCYPGFSEVTVPFFWMPKWSSTTDPSARTLDIYGKVPRGT